MTIESLLGSTPGVFIGVTIVLTGFAAYMTGRAIANTWRHEWNIIVYGLALAAVGRFLKWSLFGSDGLSVSGFIIDAACLILIGFAAYRFSRARNMVRQYPWMYDRAGPFSWKEKT